MVQSHAQASQALASGIHALPDTRTGFAATQAAYRFLNNPRVTLRALVKPLTAIDECDMSDEALDGAFSGLVGAELR
jgi:hypothetical protein